MTAISDSTRPPDPATPSESFVAATQTLREIAIRRALGEGTSDDLAPLLRGRLALRPHTLDHAFDTEVRADAVALLTHGWRAGELYTFATRRVDKLACHYLIDVLAATTRCTPVVSWAADLEQLGARIWWSWDEPHLSQWATRHGHRRAHAVRAATDVVCLLRYLPRADDLPSQTAPQAQPTPQAPPTSQATPLAC